MIEYFVFQSLNHTNYVDDWNGLIEKFSSPDDTSSVAFIFSLMVGIFCIYLSWTCNTSLNAETPLKIMYAFFAWLFGIFYLMFYFVANYLGTGCSGKTTK
jgi:apolipoprotein N-acyltransferase